VGAVAGDTLESVGSAAGNGGVLIEETFDEVCELVGLSFNEFDHFPDAARVKAFAGGEHLANGFSLWHRCHCATKLCRCQAATSRPICCGRVNFVGGFFHLRFASSGSVSQIVKEAEMSIGIFVNKQCPPTEPEISAAVGSALGRWNELSSWMTESLSARQELKYMYGQKYGWARRFHVRGALLAALYPTRNGFTAQVILNQTALEQVSRLKLGTNAKQAIDRAHVYDEGKWLFIQVESKRDVEDVEHLLGLKTTRTKMRGGMRVAGSVIDS
jgi:hypothetical protein